MIAEKHKSKKGAYGALMQVFVDASVLDTTVEFVTSKRHIQLTGVQTDEGFKTFKSVLEVPVRFDGKAWSACMPSFNINSEAESFEKLEDYVREELEVMYEEFAFDDLSPMTDSAKTLKARLLDFLAVS